MPWLQRLKALPEARLLVQHEPETPRYARARDKLDYLLRESSLLGTRAADYPQALELAFWAPHPRGRESGYYWCARAFLDDQTALVGAVVFCFWDGTEASPSFKSIDAAQSHATSDGFGAGDV